MAHSNGLTESDSRHWQNGQIQALSSGVLRAVQNQPQDVDPIVRRILFSKHFVPTYYIVLLLVIAIFSVSWRLSHKHDDKASSPVAELKNPPSRTERTVHHVLGKDAPPLESTPLLCQGSDAPRASHIWSRPYRHLKSWLLYQPRPIPAVTAAANILPSNDVSGFVVILIAINIFYLFYRNIPPYCGLDAFAVRAGLCAVMNLPVIYILAAKNNHILLRFTGWSYEGLNIFHRRLAEWMLMLACAHVLCMLGVWQTNFIPRGFSWAYFFKIRLVILGIASLSCFILLWVSSIGYVRRKAYELFLATHIIAQVAFLILLFFHHHNTRWYTGVALVVWTVDRIVVRTLLSPKKLVASLQLATDQQTVLVYVDVPLDRQRHTWNIGGGWLAGQHVFLTIPSMGSKFRYQRHPFTIASPAPMDRSAEGKWPLQLIVRGKNGFSQNLVDYAKHHQHVEVILDGPYGSPAALRALQHAERAFLIAGGSGISVTYPLAWAVQCRDSKAIISTRTTYKHGNKHVPKFSVSTRVENENYFHLWINSAYSHNGWISLLPVDPARDQNDVALNLISSTISTCDSPDGRPDVCAELSSWVRGDHHHTISKSTEICVVVSGPDEISREVRNCVSKLVREGWNIDVVAEKFNW